MNRDEQKRQVWLTHSSKLPRKCFNYLKEHIALKRLNLSIFENEIRVENWRKELMNFTNYFFNNLHFILKKMIKKVLQQPNELFFKFDSVSKLMRAHRGLIATLIQLQLIVLKEYVYDPSCSFTFKRCYLPTISGVL